jgi:VIT1/CCC1 family predicted Fe2+/Mn2+ transporter
VDRPALTPEDARTKRELPRLLDARRRLQKGNDLLPHRGQVKSGPGGGVEQSGSAGKSGALRAAIFGINDGLLTNTSLIMGFAGASQSRSVIILAGISGLLAGAFSMGTGEYVSMRVQREVLERLIHLEAHELGNDPDLEREELSQIYVRKGLPPELASQVATELMRDPKIALDTHAREELGIDPDEGLGSPWGAASSSFVMFAFGALLPLIPFFFTEGTAAVVMAGVIAAVALLTVGALTSLLTGRSAVFSAVRQLLIGVTAALVTYGIGRAIGAATGA